ncbi:dnaJ homolog subfamily C member 16 isoform X2 [Condylostylus longicornis]|uniref:dnaJ homolog subfamily C member 16 isoform X2 n=1 Tax=Condylostylus longicornis TaxID=2530218 RepID=UPI00244DE0ED|nr:dnaJ homolog subfamily C member 16 isoform X2 [Condylostylus longicornis]
MKMRYDSFPRINVQVLIILISLCTTQILADIGDPYKILGVSRQATTQEIRRAYKQLAKEWHPDKSANPDAEKRFVEIKQAYELLSDSERRRVYDQHGITNEDSHMFRQRHDYSQYGRFATDPFEEFFGHHFHFDQDISLYHKLSITTKYFDQNIIPKSSTVPHILMFYTDWCFRCIRAVGAFKKMIDTLEPLGVNFATVNAAHEQPLLRKIGIDEVPSMALILNGHGYIYKENVYNVQKVVDFIRRKLPYRLIQGLNDGTLNDFLESWMDNRARALVMEPRDQPRLRYLIAAYAFRYRVAFGFVQLNSPETKEIQERFKVHPSLDTLLIFNEDSTRAVASVSMSDIPTQTLNNVISANQYLALPRLSSQEMLEGVCPAEWNRPRKRLCVILVTENTDAHNYARHALRQIALQSGYSSERVRFAYIFQDKQSDFISALSKGSSDDTLLRLVIIWRRDTSHIKYEWVTGTRLSIQKRENESDEQTFNHTKQKLDDTIQRLLRASEALSYEALVKDLLDEHAQGALGKVLNKLLFFVDYLTDNIGQEHILPALSVLATIAFMFLVGYLMVYLVRLEEENLKRKGKLDTNNDKKLGSYVPELKLHELRAEKYNGMVRLLKPGCRTIILVTDLQSRPKLIPGFHKAVWPYRKNKTLLFGHMLIEKGLSWYAELLRLSLSESRDLQINPRNCIGTVIALNGHRKYFCMYHAKHPESKRGAKRMLKMTRRLTRRNDDPEAGAFLGMDSASDDSDTSEFESKILLEENLLDGLSNWLDRLFEGTTHRYYINYWPDFPTK